MSNATVTYRQNMVFEGVSGSGHHVLMDSSPDVGGDNQGIRPMEMVLVGLGGCTGMDVVSILNKMRVPFTAFEMEIAGSRADDHPKVYTAVTIRYRLEGNRDDVDKFIRAVTLSQEKYCSVSAMVGATATIDAEVILNGETISTLTHSV